jgi:hypothetical protein
MHFMQQAKNENKAAGSRGHTLPCHEWQVDEAERIEIHSGAIFESGVTRIKRHEIGSYLERRDGLRVTGGFQVRHAIRPGNAV